MMVDLLRAADGVAAEVTRAEERAKCVEMTMREFMEMHHYTCSVPTGPRIGFVWAGGPHKQPHDPRIDKWVRYEVIADEKPGYVRYVGKRIVIVSEA
jgi:hypothetical protein